MIPPEMIPVGTEKAGMAPRNLRFAPCGRAAYFRRLCQSFSVQPDLL